MTYCRVQSVTNSTDDLIVFAGKVGANEYATIVVNPKTKDVWTQSYTTTGLISNVKLVTMGSAVYLYYGIADNCKTYEVDDREFIRCSYRTLVRTLYSYQVQTKFKTKSI